VEPATIVLESEPGARLVADHLPGEAPALVFLHGLTSVRVGEKSSILFAEARHLGRAAWRFDFRGHGASSGELATTTLGALIADTRAVLEQAGPAVLIGSSLGGLVAAWTAARHPALVLGLSLLAPAFRFLPRLRAKLDPAGRLVLPHSGGVLEFSPRVLEDFEEHDEEEMARAIRQPTQVFHGRLDDTVPVDASEEFLARIGSARKELLVLGDGDHRLNREFPALLRRALTFHGLDRGCGRSAPASRDSAP
jgi:pimeloyl-ACP methyl ester carboxylesterase